MRYNVVRRLAVVLSLLLLAACGDDSIGLIELSPTQRVDDDPDDVPLAAIDVFPGSLDFGRVPAGTSATKTVHIQNAGEVDVQIRGVQLVPADNGFSTPPFDSVRVLQAPGGGTDIEVTYTAPDDGEAVARLRILTNLVDLGTIEVPLLANEGAHCVGYDPSPVLDFGDQRFDVEHEAIVQIANCNDREGGAKFELTDARMLDETGASPSVAYTVELLDPAPRWLAPGDTSDARIVWSPSGEDVVDEAWLEVDADDEAARPQLPVVGFASDNACPIARATCSIRRTGGVPSDELAVRPLDMLDCSAEDAFDPDPGDAIAAWRWTVIERPSGSTASFDDPEGATPSFFVDLAGRYVFELEVVDSRGTPSCEPAIVTAVAIPDEDIHVQLVWDTPGDADQTDTGFGAGTDFDLHLLHPNGCWNDRPWDCHWREAEPNWGDLARADDDPSLDIDDTDGAGPENINLNNPESDLYYRVGVNYYNDHGFGPSTATVRIYIRGVLAFEAEKELTARGEFWDVAAIEWPTGAIEVLDAVYPSAPTCR